jgi:uncharacterized LabA/DUF88 family protein
MVTSMTQAESPGAAALMHFAPNERCVLLIDGVGLHAASKALGFEIDYKLLLSLFRKRSQLVRALYYTAILDDQGHSSVRPLIDWLAYNGFSTVTKPVKEFVDVSGRRKIRNKMDVELAVDALRLAELVDHIVIISGEGDPCCLVMALQQKGKRVSIISTMKTQPPMISDELRRQADQFIDLVELQVLIRREVYHRR